MRQQDLPPPPPNYLPEEPAFDARSKYQRPRRFFSLWGVVIGLLIGFAVGLGFAWGPGAPIEFDTRPDQLRQEDKDQYIAAITLAFRYDSDLPKAVSRLTELGLGTDPFAAVADTACRWVQAGRLNSNAQIRAVRSMTTFYQLQGRTGCADQWAAEIQEPLEVVVDVPTSTPTLPPPPTKTPLTSVASPTPRTNLVPTSSTSRQYDGRIQSTFCDVLLSGIIEVFVQDGSEGVPGEPIRVQWDEGEDRFFSGLKPERGAAYADFQMEAGQSYIISMPGLSDPIDSPIVADRCFTDGGGEAITSYRVVFTQR